MTTIVHHTLFRTDSHKIIYPVQDREAKNHTLSSDDKSPYSLQNRAARAIMRANYDTSSSVLLEELCWDTLSVRRKKQKVTLMFKSIHELAPQYLQDLFTLRHTNYNLRNSDIKLALPKPRTNYLKRSFSYSGAKLWNDLPQSIRSISSLGQFKREINGIL